MCRSMRRATSRSYMAVPTTYFLMHISMGLEDPTLSCASLGCRATSAAAAGVAVSFEQGQ
jgi:hypothetical protein